MRVQATRYPLVTWASSALLPNVDPVLVWRLCYCCLVLLLPSAPRVPNDGADQAAAAGSMDRRRSYPGSCLVLRDCPVGCRSYPLGY
jgi:hypothetical protein